MARVEESPLGVLDPELVQEVGQAHSGDLVEHPGELVGSGPYPGGEGRQPEAGIPVGGLLRHQPVQPVEELLIQAPRIGRRLAPPWH
jgi:hypothetical protein